MHLSGCKQWGLQPRPGSAVTADDLRAHCRTSMADFKVPKEIVFVEEVPRTPVGKLDYQKVRQEVVRRLSGDLS